jgi:hypothetical protein
MYMFILKVKGSDIPLILLKMSAKECPKTVDFRVFSDRVEED